MCDGGKRRDWERVHRVCSELQAHFCVLLCERISLKMVLQERLSHAWEEGLNSGFGY